MKRSSKRINPSDTLTNPTETNKEMLNAGTQDHNKRDTNQIDTIIRKIITSLNMIITPTKTRTPTTSTTRRGTITTILKTRIMRMIITGITRKITRRVTKITKVVITTSTTTAPTTMTGRNRTRK